MAFAPHRSPKSPAAYFPTAMSRPCAGSCWPAPFPRPKRYTRKSPMPPRPSGFTALSAISRGCSALPCWLPPDWNSEISASSAACRTGRRGLGRRRGEDSSRCSTARRAATSCSEAKRAGNRDATPSRCCRRRRIWRTSRRRSDPNTTTRCCSSSLPCSGRAVTSPRSRKGSTTGGIRLVWTRRPASSASAKTSLPGASPATFIIKRMTQFPRSRARR